MAELGAVVPSHMVIKGNVLKDLEITVERDGGVLLEGRWQAR